jgi:hypothetical protein
MGSLEKRLEELEAWRNSGTDHESHWQPWIPTPEEAEAIASVLDEAGALEAVLVGVWVAPDELSADDN